jgi:hypothetical protein
MLFDKSAIVLDEGEGYDVATELFAKCFVLRKRNAAAAGVLFHQRRRKRG